MKNRKRSSISGPFVPILKTMIKSPAFMELTNPSRVAYLLLKLQCTHFEQQEVKLPFNHVLPYMGKNTFSRSIDQLVSLGFIEKSFVGGLFRRTNIYRFSKAWEGINIKPHNLVTSIRGTENHTTKFTKNKKTGMDFHTT